MVNVKPVTLYDVAEYAGVSYQTVSRVVNQASHVSAKTREKVEAAMAELNYIPNRVAQQLAGKQSLLIGVATSSLALHAPSQIVAAIKSRADQLGASVVVSMVERSGVEACKAAVHNLSLIHISIHLNFADTRAHLQLNDMISALENIIKNQIPSDVEIIRVYTMHDADRHQDHLAVYQASMVACRAIPQILGYETLSTLSLIHI